MFAISSDKRLQQNEYRILLLAYACNPYRGGEHGVGWQRAVATAKYFETWVICREQSNARAIADYMSKEGGIANLHFCFVPMSRLEMAIKKKPGFFYLAYNLWHRRAYRLAKKLHAKRSFHIVHQATMCGFREPGYVWKLNAPFVWGPVGGTQNYPFSFLRCAGIIGACTEIVRTIINIIHFRLSRRVRNASQRAALLLTANSTVKADFERVHDVQPVTMLDVGTSGIWKPIKDRLQSYGPLKILWVGVIERRKALHLLLLALSKLPSSISYELRILGDGPQREQWKQLAEQNQINCTWQGWLPHSEALAQYEWADVFVFTSLRDTFGTVVLEALSRGVPVVCLDHQGVRDVVTTECGVKIAVTNPTEVVLNLCESLAMLAKDRELLYFLSLGAIERARSYEWCVKGEEMAKLYSHILDR